MGIVCISDPHPVAGPAGARPSPMGIVCISDSRPVFLYSVSECSAGTHGNQFSGTIPTQTSVLPRLFEANSTIFPSKSQPACKWLSPPYVRCPMVRIFFSVVLALSRAKMPCQLSATTHFPSEMPAACHLFACEGVVNTQNSKLPVKSRVRMTISVTVPGYRISIT